MRTLLLILVLCGGAGAWNYHRNLQAERAEPRPYRSLTEEALASLAAALEAEVEDLTSSYEAASGRKVSITEEALLGEKVREFERVQSISQSTRAIGQRLSQSEGSLQRVRKELRRREEESDLLRLHLRRLISF
jgi:hypothetical protein